MNILSAEEMKEAEQVLLKVVPRHNYIFVFPQEQHFEEISSFISKTFPKANSNAEQAVSQVVTLTDNLKGLSLQQPNSVYHMLMYSILSILYRDKYRQGANNQGESTHYLLETLKCSLYSPDIDFTAIKGVDFPVETVQMKAMAARFLSLMEEQSLKLTVNRLKCAEWICQHNPIIVETFVLFFRFILMRLEIQGANNYRSMGSLEETVVNLIEYFDLGYRNFGQLFLFYEQGIFLSFTESDIIVGDYFENQSQKKNQMQQFQIKSSVKLNMIESFLLNVDDKNAAAEAAKRKGIVDSDVKLLNFMLDNSSDEQAEKAINKQKDCLALETPQFNQGSQDLLQFGRKRKSTIIKDKQDNSLRHEFKKLINDNSDSEGLSHSDNEAPTPFLGGEQQLSISSRFQSKQDTSQQPNPAHMDSPIDELNSVNAMSMHEDRDYMNDFPKKAGNNHNYQAPHTAKVRSHFIENFDGQVDPHFYKVESHEVLHTYQDDLYELANCKCRKIKNRRMEISNNIVSMSITPDTHGAAIYSRRSPGRKYTGNNFDVSAKQTPKYFGSPTNRYQDKTDHKPAFLKNLKKNKEQNSQVNRFSQSTVGEDKNKTMEFPLTRQNTFNHKLTQKKSTILSHQVFNHMDNFRSKQKQRKDPDCRSFNGGVNKKNYHNSFQPEKGNEPQPETWQTTSNFHQRVPNYMQLNKGTSNFMSNPNVKANQAEPYKFYAPVQIIAPTVYFNSPKNNSNNVIVKVNDFSGKRHPNNPEAKTAPYSHKNDSLLGQKNSNGMHSCSSMNSGQHL